MKAGMQGSTFSQIEMDGSLQLTLEHATTGGQAFVLCAIRKQAKSSKEIAMIHSALSAGAINDFISSLDLKGVYMKLLCCCLIWFFTVTLSVTHIS
jgi:hypothetical protein